MSERYFLYGSNNGEVKYVKLCENPPDEADKEWLVITDGDIEYCRVAANIYVNAFNRGFVRAQNFKEDD